MVMHHSFKYWWMGLWSVQSPSVKSYLTIEEYSFYPTQSKLEETEIPDRLRSKVLADLPLASKYQIRFITKLV